jgi:hypothetical protein
MAWLVIFLHLQFVELGNKGLEEIAVPKRGELKEQRGN